MRRSLTDIKLRLTPRALAIAAVAMVLADFATLVSPNSFLPGGPLDETAHFLTTLLVMWALGPRICKRFLAPALIASVLIDIDHIPGRFGIDWLTEGTPRPYTHSLTLILVVLAGAGLSRSRGRRDLLIGVALGLAIHFFRDLADPGSGVSLLWPLSKHAFSIPHASYLLVLAGFVALDAYRCRTGPRRRVREPLAESTGR
jgi:hypothetical protein